MSNGRTAKQEAQNAAEYREARLFVATLLRTRRRELSTKQWQQVLRFWELRGENKELPRYLIAP